MSIKRVRVESTAPFNGLPLIVAHEEGLFAEHSLEVVFPRVKNPLKTDVNITDPNIISSTGGMHGGLFETAAADLFNACEWGNYRRSQDSNKGARQIGRRPAVACGAIVVPPWSDIYTPQNLANRPIATPFHHGTHYLALQLLEGFLRLEEISLVSSGGRAERYRSMMDGTTDACTATEPWITVAEKAGCRIVAQAFYHGTDVASDALDDETIAAFTLSVTEAVRRINANKADYVHYYIDYDWYTTPPSLDNAPEVKALTVDDFNLARLHFVEPALVPEEEFERTYEWMVSRNLLDGGLGMSDLVDNRVTTPDRG